MVDTRIRKNERCVIGLPACDYVFSSTRSCFIAYGFSTSSFEKDILKQVLEEKGIEAVEAGDQFDPGKYAFCIKICSKIIVSQFCIVLLNEDVKGHNANVSIEYGLMLGHNKYVIPFQREADSLPFNVSGLDTVKYNQKNFRDLAVKAIDHAINETSQSQPTRDIDNAIGLFLLMNDTTLANIEINSDDRIIFELGNTFGFNLLTKFDGLSYIYFGNFGMLSDKAIIWRLSKFLTLFSARLGAIPIRLQLGLAKEEGREVLKIFLEKLQIWLVVADEQIKLQIIDWYKALDLQLPLEIFTLNQISEAVTHLPI